jgi:hypothetical protein
MITFILTLLLSFNNFSDFDSIQKEIVKKRTNYSNNIKHLNLEFSTRGKKTTFLKTQNSKVLIKDNNIYISNNNYNAILNNQNDSIFIETIVDNSKNINLTDFSETIKSLPWICFFCEIDLSRIKNITIESIKNNLESIDIEFSSCDEDDRIKIIKAKIKIEKIEFKIIKYDISLYRKDLKCKISYKGEKLYKNGMLDKEIVNTIYHTKTDIVIDNNYNFNYPSISNEEIDKMATLKYWGLKEIKLIKPDYSIYIGIVIIVLLLGLVKVNSILRKNV